MVTNWDGYQAYNRTQTYTYTLTLKIVEIKIDEFFRWFTRVFLLLETFHYATIFFVHFFGEYYL
jgi:hypothetical protein